MRILMGSGVRDRVEAVTPTLQQRVSRPELRGKAQIR
jgi:hypothetical protein